MTPLDKLKRVTRDLDVALEDYPGLMEASIRWFVSELIAHGETLVEMLSIRTGLGIDPVFNGAAIAAFSGSKAAAKARLR